MQMEQDLLGIQYSGPRSRNSQIMSPTIPLASILPLRLEFRGFLRARENYFYCALNCARGEGQAHLNNNIWGSLMANST